MNSQDFLTVVVNRNMFDFQSDQADIRKAFNAIMAVDALAARIFLDAGGQPGTGHKDDTAYREALAQRDRHFCLTRVLAKASKHARLARGNPTLTGADQIGYHPGAFQLGAFQSNAFDVGRVYVVTDEGTRHDVVSVLAMALACLSQEMKKFDLRPL